LTKATDTFHEDLRTLLTISSHDWSL